MFPEDKIIEIFSMCDDFSKVFDSTVQKSAITDSEHAKKRKYHRDGKMSDSEVPEFGISSIKKSSVEAIVQCRTL